MSEENAANAANEVNEVDNIRNILFGEQAQQIEERFISVEKSIASLQRETRHLRQLLDVECSAREKADQALNELVQAMDKRLQQELAALEERTRAELRTRDDTWKKHLSEQVHTLESLMQILQKHKNSLT